MKQFIRTYWKTLLFFAVIGLLGGFFSGLYLLDSYPAQLQQQLVAELESSGLGQIPADLLLGVVAAMQSAGYGIVLGAAGIWLGKKTGLWRDQRVITRRPLAIALAVGLAGGLAMILSDVLLFAPQNEAILNSYAAKPTVWYLLATVTYGAVIEEVMMRLFFLSLVAFVLHRLFAKHREKPTTAVLIIANVLSAVLFAAGHLPTTAILLGLNPLTIFRCFLLNGGLGLPFGWLYRKYGLRYAMIAHGACHVVSKLIWMLFL